MSAEDSVEMRRECCRIRKVEPLGRALAGNKAWITGQRRAQSNTRSSLAVHEDDPDAEAAAEKLLAEKAPTVAPYWSGPDSCSVWPYPPTGTREEIHAEGAGQDDSRLASVATDFTRVLFLSDVVVLPGMVVRVELDERN